MMPTRKLAPIGFGNVNRALAQITALQTHTILFIWKLTLGRFRG